MVKINCIRLERLVIYMEGFISLFYKFFFKNEKKTNSIIKLGQRYEKIMSRKEDNVLIGEKCSTSLEIPNV